MGLHRGIQHRRRGGGVGIGIIGGLIAAEALRSSPGTYEGADPRSASAPATNTFHAVIDFACSCPWSDTSARRMWRRREKRAWPVANRLIQWMKSW